MKIRKLIGLSLAVGSIFLIRIGVAEMKDVTLYYLPFELQTLTSISTKLISEKAHCVFKLSSDSEEVKSLQTIINTAREGKFDDLVVRLKIEGLFADNIYVDMDGGVLLEKKPPNTRTLNESSFSELKKLIKELRKKQPKNCRINS
jgi:hypothetical protein